MDYESEIKKIVGYQAWSFVWWKELERAEQNLIIFEEYLKHGKDKRCPVCLCVIDVLGGASPSQKEFVDHFKSCKTRNVRVGSSSGIPKTETVEHVTTLEEKVIVLQVASISWWMDLNRERQNTIIYRRYKEYKDKKGRESDEWND